MKVLFYSLHWQVRGQSRNTESMIDQFVISESVLIPHRKYVLAGARSLEPRIAVDLTDSRYGDWLVYYLLLSHWPELLSTPTTEEVLVYSRYYWFLRFVRDYTEVHGEDAGLDQQAFQILEFASGDVDWNVIAAIQESIQR